MNTHVFTPYLIPLIFLLLFFISYRFNRTNLLAGLLLSCCLLSFLIIAFTQVYASKSPIAKIFLAFILGIFFLLAVFGLYIIAAFLIMNTFSILRKEKRSLKHGLTLLLAVLLLLTAAVPHLTAAGHWPPAVVMLFNAADGLIIYYLLHLTQFIISLILCNLSRPHKNQDFLIVLGAFVRNGKVTPLLAGRIDKAIAFYHQQKAVTNPPKLVLSGGKGVDEICTEAQAMHAYAIRQGIPPQDLLLEMHSVSTFENMKFSKAIMDQTAAGRPYRCIYVTTNYHVLRAGILARKVGLKITGIGSKTALYFLPNAILREYLGYLYLHLKWNIFFALCSLAFGILFPIIMTRLSMD